MSTEMDVEITVPPEECYTIHMVNLGDDRWGLGIYRGHRTPAAVGDERIHSEPISSPHPPLEEVAARLWEGEGIADPIATTPGEGLRDRRGLTLVSSWRGSNREGWYADAIVGRHWIRGAAAMAGRHLFR